MDNAILACYGWEDLNLRHDFYQNERGQTRFTLSGEARRQVINRLLKLNVQIAALEASQEENRQWLKGGSGMNFMKIRNINGTSDTTCRCGSWLAHWQKFSGQKRPMYCPARDCLRKDLEGAHVQKGGESTDQKWYIYPLCTEHNKYKGELEVSTVYTLVPANKSETCERRTGG